MPLILIMLFVECSSKEDYHKEWKENDGYVPDSLTAVKIADVIVARIYGEKEISSERNVIVSESDSTWIVQSTLKPGEDGGVFYVEIRKKDCKIVSLNHSK